MAAGVPAPLRLVDDTFVNANTGAVVELHGLSWVSAQRTSATIDSRDMPVRLQPVTPFIEMLQLDLLGGWQAEKGA